MKRQLPDWCYSVQYTTDEVIRIHNGETGYYPVFNPMIKTLEEAIEFANIQNGMLGILPEERLAMEIGSMFGWDAMGADPQVYLDRAEFVEKKRVKGDIKEKTLTIMYPINVDVYVYKLLDKPRYFIALEDMPEHYPPVRYEEINGKKFVPVKFRDGEKHPAILVVM